MYCFLVVVWIVFLLLLCGGELALILSSVYFFHPRVWRTSFASDIDECATGAHSCEFSCENTDNGYNCVCDPGYEGDGVTCVGKFEAD